MDGSRPFPASPTPPDEVLARLRLLRSRRVGPATWRRLLAAHGTAAEALRALPAIARAAGLDGYEPCPEGVARAELRAGQRLGARLIGCDEPAYPAALAGLADGPPLLWARGDLALLGRPAVAIVGARSASSLGLRMARALAAGLAEAGLLVVSGLARGIDAEAHRAACPATAAVMAGGVDIAYPPENAALAAEIAARGLCLSEQPPGLEPQARHFPARNRIVAGLALGVIVVEAAERSGSLITARQAADQGREVMAVPGHPLDPRAAGCNLLLRDGATLLRGVEDALQALAPALGALGRDPAPRGAAAPAPHPPPAAAPAPTPAAAGDLRARALERLGPSPVAEDQLLRDLRAAPAALAPVLLDLELEGLVERQPGGLLARRV